MGDEPSVDRNSVLFWRDLTPLNGADICLEAYEKLASKYPHIDFVIAVRPWFEESPGAEELSRRFGNVKIYRFPYPSGISLPLLMNKALCVLLPFRTLTIDPQMAVLESLAFGRPVITTNIQSNPEYIRNGVNGFLIPPNDAVSAINAISSLLLDKDKALKMGTVAADSMAHDYSWQEYARQLMEIYESTKEKN